MKSPRQLKKEADMGSTEALFKLGGIYKRGDGIRKNRVQALKWFMLAAWRGDEDAEMQGNLVGSDLTEMQERRALAGALRWKLTFDLKLVVSRLLSPNYNIRAGMDEADEDDLPCFIKLPPKYN